MSGDSDKISVSVRFPGGARWTKVPFWMTDGQIIRDTCDKLGPFLAPNPEDCTVVRESRP